MNAERVLSSLRPGSSWTCNADDYNQLEWLEPSVSDGGQPKPTREEWDAEWERQKKLAELNSYKMKRMHEYPDLKEFVDAYYWIQEGDDTKMNIYLEKCKQVKNKYPKPQ